MGEPSSTDCDFSHLPDVVWVEIMTLLSLEDRYHVSVCCHSLYDIFNHPSLWHTVNISFLGTSELAHLRQASVEIPQKYYAIVAKFIHYIKDLTLRIFGQLEALSGDWLDLLINLEISGAYNLERLTLDVGDTQSHYADVLDGPPNSGAIYTLLGFVRASNRLKGLIIKAWPLHLFLNFDVDLVTVILKNKYLQSSLETLCLYWPKKNDWVTKHGVVPTVDKTKALLNHLCALQHLSLRSTMIDEETINILSSSGHAPLKHLDILVIYSRHDNLNVPEISSASWVALKQHAPQLKVTCSVMTRVPAIELSAMLKPEVPLVAMTFLKYSYCDGEILLSLAAKYNRTLTKFIDFSSGEASDIALLELVKQCKLLKYLVYHRSVHFSTVQKLAQLREKSWEQFEFQERSVLTQNQEEEESNVVIEQTESGGLVMRDFQRFHECEEVRQSKMKAMIEHVCENVGYNWTPLGK